MEEVKPRNKMSWKTMLGMAIGIGVVTGIQATRNTNPYNKLVDTSEEINEKGAVTLDQDTRLDSTSVIKEPLTLVYYYTVVNVNNDSVPIDVNDATKFLRKQAQENYDTTPEMEDFRKHDIYLKYAYKDKKGKYLFDFTIKPAKNIQ
jgi:hypothetical protein